MKQCMRSKNLQWCEIAELLEMIIALLIDDLWRAIVTAMDDPMADLLDASLRVPSLFVQMLQEERERALVV